jgi:ABC-type multidrug transport system permease subunit
MEAIVTIVSLCFGFVAYVRRNEKIRRQIWNGERQTMTRFESFFRSLVYGLVITVVSSFLISFALNSLGLEV